VPHAAVGHRESGDVSSRVTRKLHDIDEPTVAMDVESRHAFWMTMRRFASSAAFKSTPDSA